MNEVIVRELSGEGQQESEEIHRGWRRGRMAQSMKVECQWSRGLRLEARKPHN